MKHQRLPKFLFCCAFGLMLTVSLRAQNSPNPQQSVPPGPRGQAPPPQPGPRGGAPLTTTTAGNNFLSTAIEINQAEIELGQLATTKAQSERVKTYAQMLIK